MALVGCSECGQQVSDKAIACPNCGAPVANPVAEVAAPTTVSFRNGEFIAARSQLVSHTVKAVQALDYKVDDANEQTGLVTFTTGMTWGSWSGVSGTIYLEEVGTHRFVASGNAKQNVKGGQVLAFNIGNEAGKKVRNVIAEMEKAATK